MRVMARSDGKISDLASRPVGRGLGRRALAALAASADVVRIPAGTLADVGRHHRHVVLEGTVAVSRDGAVAGTAGPGEPIDPSTAAPVSLVALSDAVLLVIEVRAFHDATL